MTEGSDDVGEVWNAIHASLTKPRKAHKGGKLWVSGIGSCARAVALSLLGAEAEQPSLESLLIMRGGIAWESQTARELIEVYGDDVTTQLRLSDENWSGYADMTLFHKSKKASPVIIEHKAQGPKSSFGKPQVPHLLQVALYGWLYEKEFGVAPRLKLFYRKWGEWAEYDVGVFPEVMQVSGACMGKPWFEQIEISLDERREYMEMLRNTGNMPPYEQTRGCRWCPYADPCSSAWNEDDETASVMRALEKAALPR